MIIFIVRRIGKSYNHLLRCLVTITRIGDVSKIGYVTKIRNSYYEWLQSRRLVTVLQISYSDEDCMTGTKIGYN